MPEMPILDLNRRLGDADRLIDRALAHVPFEGMNGRSLAAAARELGFAPAYAATLVPRGGAGLAMAYHRRIDQALAASLAADPPQGRVREHVAEAVMRRLALADPELVRAAAAVLALPANAALGLRLTGETADVIWEALGDASDGFAWWTRRASLAAVFGATVIYWLGDRSPGAAETRAFLDRRIGEVLRLGEAGARARRLPGWTPLARAATGWVRAPRGTAGGERQTREGEAGARAARGRRAGGRAATEQGSQGWGT